VAAAGDGIASLVVFDAAGGSLEQPFAGQWVKL
jgi:hypothetical protein